MYFRKFSSCYTNKLDKSNPVTTNLQAYNNQGMPEAPGWRENSVEKYSGTSIHGYDSGPECGWPWPQFLRRYCREGYVGHV